MVETPTGASGSGPHVHFYLLRGDGTPTRGGSRVIWAGSKQKEQEVEIDRSAADQVGADTRAIIVEGSIDEFPRAKAPRQPVRVLEAARRSKWVDIRIDLGTAEGASGIYKARVKLDGRDGAPDVEYDAYKRSGEDGNSYSDFEIDSDGAANRIGNLQDSVKRGVAFATLIVESDGKGKDKQRSAEQPRRAPPSRAPRCDRGTQDVVCTGARGVRAIRHGAAPREAAVCGTRRSRKLV